MPRYLKTRGHRQVYHFQRAIPPDVKGLVDASLFREKSLGTADLRLAEKLARPLIVKTDDAIDHARAMKNVPNYSANLTPVEQRELEHAGGPIALHREIASDVVQHRFLDIGSAMSAIVPDDMLADRVSAQLARMEGKADAAQLAELSQIIREKARTLHKLGVVVDEIKGMTAAIDPGLHDVVADWAKKSNQPAQTVRQFTYAVRRFCEVNGDLPVKDLTKDHIRAFANRLPELPATVPVKHLELPFDDIVFLGQRKGWATLAPATVTRHLSGLRVIMGHAVSQGFVADNPFAGFRNVTPKGRKSDAKKKKRRSFTVPELKHLLATIDIEKSPRDDDYWPPLVSAYQGARLEEICQLDKADVIEVAGILCLRITDALDEEAGDTGKKLKTNASVRTVPVHPVLIEMGFLDFVRASQGRRDGPKLFRFEPDQRGRFGGPYGKRFARLLREKAKITDPKLVFHSFRHTWTDAARNAGLPFEIRAALAGRETEDDGTTDEALRSSEAGYGDGHSVKSLLEHLAKVDPLRTSQPYRGRHPHPEIGAGAAGPN